MAVAAQLGVGDVLAGFRVEGLLGRGGMGVVYRASEVALARPVALKLLAPELAADPSFRERFLREARLAARLEHPHVLPVYAAGEERGLLFLALRFVDGEDLGRVLERGPLAAGRAGRIVSQLASALQAAHTAGLLHRDVKPGNVLLSGSEGEEHAYLCDFGLARPQDERSLTGGSELLGTLDYLAPEQIERGEADARSDLYALGCLLYACLTGKPPFAREQAAATLWAHLKEPPPRPSAQRPELPAALDKVVAVALAKAPGERYQSAGELAQALETALAGKPAPTRKARPRRQTGPPPPSNLPAPASSFLGRRRELGELRALLRRKQLRLLTLTGPGGTGKSRLALQAAAQALRHFPDGVFFVALAPLREPALVLPTLAQTLGLREQSGTTPLEALQEHLAEKTTLLVLDNFEHLLQPTPPLTELLAACPGLRMLVTSREPLHLDHEHEYPVPPLDESEAVALFAERARTLAPGFAGDEALAAICRRLDCLPLAVELAAGRVRVLSPTQLLARLSQRLPLLASGPADAPERQQTLRATIAWSHELLTPDEQQLFRRLAVFAGGCTLEAAEEVCAAQLDPLQALVEQNLLRHSDERFTMLETIREYAAEQLDQSHEAEQLRQLHAHHYLTLAEQAEPQLRGPALSTWLGRLEAEHANLRQALDVAHALPEPELELRLAGACSRFWYLAMHLREGRERLEHAQGRARGQQPALQAPVLEGLSNILMWQGDADASLAVADESLRLRRALGDPRGLLRPLNNRARAAAAIGDWEAARASFNECRELARQVEDEWYFANATLNLGDLALQEGDFERALDLAEEAYELYRRLHDERVVLICLANIASAELELGKVEAARERLRQNLSASREAGAWDSMIDSLEGLAVAAERTGEDELAARLIGSMAAAEEGRGYALQPFERGRRQRTLEALRGRCGSERLAALLAEGEATPLEDAVERALQLDSEELPSANVYERGV